MFRLRKQSVNQQSQLTSSLSSGNASIVKPQYQHHEEDYNTEEIMKEAIDLQASTTPAPQQKELPDELTIESMSAVIAAAVQMSTSGGSPSSLGLGSASIIKPTTTSPTSPSSSTSTSSSKRRFSTRLFSSWRKSASLNNSSDTLPAASLDSTLTVSSEEDGDSVDSPRSSSGSGWPKTPDDDGRDELIYRGIQIKEIKTTLKTLVISDQVANPMPKVQLERPGFARINY